MPKTVKISLKGIVQKIDKAMKEMKKAQKKAITASEKQKLTLKISNLRKIRRNVEANCPHPPGGSAKGMTIIVPTQ
jgi:mannitol-specific phosphotransferase system IIBC component